MTKSRIWNLFRDRTTHLVSHLPTLPYSYCGIRDPVVQTPEETTCSECLRVAAAKLHEESRNAHEMLTRLGAGGYGVGSLRERLALYLDNLSELPTRNQVTAARFGVSERDQ